MRIFFVCDRDSLRSYSLPYLEILRFFMDKEFPKTLPGDLNTSE